MLRIGLDSHTFSSEVVQGPSRETKIQYLRKESLLRWPENRGRLLEVEL